MRITTALKRLCRECKVVKRGKKVFVLCTANPKHKQRQKFSTWARSPAQTSSLKAQTDIGIESIAEIKTNSIISANALIILKGPPV